MLREISRKEGGQQQTTQGTSWLPCVTCSRLDFWLQWHNLVERSRIIRKSPKSYIPTSYDWYMASFFRCDEGSEE